MRSRFGGLLTGLLIFTPEFTPRSLRRIMVVATIAALVAMGMPSGAGVASAHCPGGAPKRTNVVGTLILGGASTGIEGWIGYTNPNPCANNQGNAFSAEYVTLSRTWDNQGWVQTGWIKRQGWSAPRYYCEFTGNNNGFWHLHDGTTAISATTHKWRFHTITSEGQTDWHCEFDGSPIIHTHSVGQLGFNSGVHLQSGGEAYAEHGQIGTNAPSKLGFTVLKHRSGTLWVTTNYGFGAPPAPYGLDEPAVGQLRNWTNAH